MALLSLSSLQTPQHTDGSYLSQVKCRESLFCPLDHWIQLEKGDVLQGTGTFPLPAHQEAARLKAHSNFQAGFEGTCLIVQCQQGGHRAAVIVVRPTASVLFGGCCNESGIPATTLFPKHPLCWVVAVVLGETKIVLFSVGNTVPVGQGCAARPGTHPGDPRRGCRIPSLRTAGHPHTPPGRAHGMHGYWGRLKDPSFLPFTPI